MAEGYDFGLRRGLCRLLLALIPLAFAYACDKAKGGESEFGLDQRPSNSSCLAGPRPLSGPVQVQLTRKFEGLGNLNELVYIVQAPGDERYWYALEQSGRVLVFANQAGVRSYEVFLDIRDRVQAGGEAGLLGLAFAPDYAQSGRVYVSYTSGPRPGSNQALESRISRFRRNAQNPLRADLNSEEVLLRLDQFAGNHNGGWIGFGPDGFLYVAFGDGGGGGDPENTGQDLQRLLGKVLRLNVGGGSGYAIPADNPFAQGGGRAEIFAWGFRNPWRLSFDSMTGELWGGDVGQGALEEVDKIVRGGNYGWRIKEGSRCYASASCNGTGLIDPVAEYGRDEGQSITGGYVYRGEALPELQGMYLYGDFVSGALWALTQNGETPSYTPQFLAATGLSISSFAQDARGEVYVLNYQPGGIYALERRSGAPAPMDFPPLLSQTGCFDASDPRKAAPGLIPYGVNSPLWSDGAEKERWLALPDGSTIAIQDDGDWEFPPGSVLIKRFRLEGRYLETRFMVRHDDGSWAGYTYVWNEAQNDAVLTRAETKIDLGPGRSWTAPSRAQCIQCHTEAAGRSLGLETAQLNRSWMYAGQRQSNQLATLSHIGMFAAALAAPPSALPAYPDPHKEGPVEARARSYLHANCSFCHRPNAPGRGNIDLRFSRSLSETMACNKAPEEGDLAVAGARVIASGDAARSLLTLRMRALDDKRMPPLGSQVVDEAGVQLLGEWISALQSCAN